MMGLAWASCWPSALQSASENNPIPILLGALCALLPDTLDFWIAQPFHKPDIHIVSPPEAPAPLMIAEALTQALSKSHKSRLRLDLVCYPMPIGPDQWIPYTLYFDAPRRHISVMVAGANPCNAVAAAPVGFITAFPGRIIVCDEPLSLRVEPLPDGRVSFVSMPSDHQWSHSLVIALASGILAAGAWGLTAGIIAGGAYALHILTHHLGYSGTALLWPFKKNCQPGFQWITPRQNPKMDFALLWLALLLLAGNIIRATSPVIDGPSLLQLLLFGGAIPLAMQSFFRLNKTKSDENTRPTPPHPHPPDQGAHAN